MAELDALNEQPVLWVSRDSYFATGKAIRGGIAVCWPWFASHPTDDGRPAQLLQCQRFILAAVNDGRRGRRRNRLERAQAVQVKVEPQWDLLLESIVRLSPVALAIGLNECE